MNMHRRYVPYHGYIFIVLIVLHCTILLSYAAEIQTQESKQENSLIPGSWGLQLQFADYFNTMYVPRFNISFKRQLSPSSALRFGTGFDWYTLDSDTEEEIGVEGPGKYGWERTGGFRRKSPRQ